MSPRTRLAVGVLAALVVLAGLVIVGRWEGERHARSENAAIARTRALVGRLDAPPPTGYRLLNQFSCLTYRRGPKPYALELCIDRDGRVVEAIDRRGSEPRIASLREDPDAATVRVDRRQVDRLLHALGA